MMSQICPVIGITCSSVIHNQIPSYLIHEKLVRSVIQAGGVPAIIPTGPSELVEAWMNICHGVILSGGEDIDPNSFQANPSSEIKETNPKRDIIEIELVKRARQKRIPILGLCRGMTLLNVALGGTVIQDIKSQIQHAINHEQQTARTEPTHSIEIDEASRLFQILRRTTIRVNSMHHQAIDGVSPELKKVAVAPDGVIEAVEALDETSPMIMGIQWHPEEMASEGQEMQHIFHSFILECQKYITSMKE